MQRYHISAALAQQEIVQDCSTIVAQPRYVIEAEVDSTQITPPLDVRNAARTLLCVLPHSTTLLQSHITGLSRQAFEMIA